MTFRIEPGVRYIELPAGSGLLDEPTTIAVREPTVGEMSGYDRVDTDSLWWRLGEKHSTLAVPERKLRYDKTMRTIYVDLETTEAEINVRRQKLQSDLEESERFLGPNYFDDMYAITHLYDYEIRDLNATSNNMITDAGKSLSESVKHLLDTPIGLGITPSRRYAGLDMYEAETKVEPIDLTTSHCMLCAAGHKPQRASDYSRRTGMIDSTCRSLRKSSMPIVTADYETFAETCKKAAEQIAETFYIPSEAYDPTRSLSLNIMKARQGDRMLNKIMLNADYGAFMLHDSDYLAALTQRNAIVREAAAKEDMINANLMDLP